MRKLFFIISCILLQACQSKHYQAMQIVQEFVNAQNQYQTQVIDRLLDPGLVYLPYSDKQAFMDGLQVSKAIHNSLEIVTIRQEGKKVYTTEVVRNDLIDLYDFREEKTKSNIYSLKNKKIIRIQSKEKNLTFLKKEKNLWRWIHLHYPKEGKQIRQDIKSQKAFQTMLQRLILKYKQSL